MTRTGSQPTALEVLSAPSHSLAGLGPHTADADAQGLAPAFGERTEGGAAWESAWIDLGGEG